MLVYNMALCAHSTGMMRVFAEDASLGVLLLIGRPLYDSALHPTVIRRALRCLW